MRSSEFSRKEVRAYGISVYSDHHIDELLARPTGINLSSDFPRPICTTVKIYPFQYPSTEGEESATHALKFIAVTFISPFAAAGTAVDASNAEAMLTPAPHGLALLGRLASDLLGVPLTPSAGETAA